jgi:uracil-DNA glycosylase family 4
MADFRDQLRNPGCDICPLSEGAQHVCLMGNGPFPAKIMIIGEAPGKREDEQHKAFVGPAGQLLDIALEEHAGLTRNDCYITNVCRCRPPANRTPELREIKACVESYLWDEMQYVDPEFILLLGNSALRGVVKKSGITKQAGNVWEKVLAGKPRQVMATIHPALVLRNPRYKDLFVADIARFGRLVEGIKDNSSKTRVKIITTASQLRWLLHELLDADIISYDIETYTKPARPPFVTTNFQEWHGEASQIASIAFTWKEGMGACIPLHHERSPWKDPDAVLRILRPALVRKNVKLIAHNGKFDARWLHAKGIPLEQTFDTMLAAHMIDENRPKGLKPLSRTLLGVDAYDVGEEGLGSAVTVPLRRLCVYNCKDTDYTLRLYNILKEQLKQDERAARVFIKLMMPASNALVDIERHGVYIDAQRWQERHDEAQENVSKLYRFINQYVSKELRPINLRSTQQVGKWLYGNLDLPVLEKTKSGNPGTREGVLLRLAAEHEHPAIKALLKYRKWTKYLNTYLLPWWFEHGGGLHGRIYSNYKLFGTVTGRLSGEGGIQQVPRDPFIRSIIGAPPGWRFVQADYSQIELRIAAMVAHEDHMLRQYSLGEDIHMGRAMKMTGKLATEVTKEERKKAKAVNFGYVYGMGAKKFVIYAFENYDVRISQEEAEKDRRGFFEDYPALKHWHERQRRLARRYGVVYSPLGRARHLPDILSQEESVRAEAERQAINSPVQATASDMMLFSLVQIHKRLNPKEAAVVGTVHDSILFEVREDCVEEYCTLIKNTMEDVASIERAFQCEITVPIVADVEYGDHWAEGEPWQPAALAQAA